MGDNHVDRPGVEGEQSLELTGTNRPDTLITLRCSFGTEGSSLCSFPLRYTMSYGSWAHRDQISGADSGGVPPVPIPNTAVKTVSADGSRTAGSLESRTAPDYNDEPAAQCARRVSVFAYGTSSQHVGRKAIGFSLSRKASSQESVWTQAIRRLFRDRIRFAPDRPVNIRSRILIKLFARSRP